MQRFAGWILESLDGKFLLQLRDNIPTIRFPGVWDLFGGGVEEGETPLEGALRELKEEIGIVLPPEAASLVLEKYLLGGMHYIFHAYIPYKEEEITVYEGEACKYCTKAEIEEIPNMVEELKEIFRNL